MRPKSEWTYALLSSGHLSVDRGDAEPVTVALGELPNALVTAADLERLGFALGDAGPTLGHGFVLDLSPTVALAGTAAAAETGVIYVLDPEAGDRFAVVRDGGGTPRTVRMMVIRVPVAP